MCTIGIQYRALHPVFRRIPQDRLQILLALQIQINLGQVFISLGKIWKISYKEEKYFARAVEEGESVLTGDMKDFNILMELALLCTS